MRVNNVGNKAKSLALLVENNIKVPNFYALTNAECMTLTNLIDDDKEVDKYLASINFYDNVNKLRRPLIVRSSSSNEDETHQSNAGKYLSIYNIQNDNELIDSIYNCWNSKDDNFDMGVIIQEQVNPYFSGVSFISKNNGKFELIIEVVIGLGELLVSGFVSPVRYIYNFQEKKFKVHQEFTQRVAMFPKIDDSIFEPCVDVTINDKRFRVISIVNNVLYAMLAYKENYCEKIEEVLEAVKEKSIMIHNIFGDSDIEWVFNEELLIVQRRPITTEAFVNMTDETNDFGGTTIVPGNVTGKLVHINDFNGEEDSIVYAQAIFPQNFDVLMNAKGIISIESSLLSHTAILAREMKLPYWSGVDKSIFNKYKNKIVTIDFKAKTIELVDEIESKYEESETLKYEEAFNETIYDLLTLDVIRKNNLKYARLSRLSMEMLIEFYGELLINDNFGGKLYE